MSQHDMNIQNQTGAPFRADLNSALEALATQQSGNTEPTTTYPFQHWVDTAGTTALLKIRNAANNAWQTVRAVGATFEAFYTNNAERMRILADGKVGIGTTTPAYALDVNGDVNATQLRINGTPVGNLASNVVVNTFNGTGSQTAFTLTQAPTGTNNIDVFISGVRQAAATYSVTGTTLTFAVAPPLGTGNIEVKIGGTLSIGTPGALTVGTGAIIDDSVTNAKLANMPANTVKVNNTASSGDPVDLALGVSQVIGRGPTGDVRAVNFSELANSAGIAKAWVNFNGTGTVAIRGSLNVSSITDNGTGDYTVNFATAMANTNYAVVAAGSGEQATANPAARQGPAFGNAGQAVGSVRICCGADNGVFTDWPTVSIAVFAN